MEEEIEEVDNPAQEIDRTVSEDLQSYLSDKFDVLPMPGRNERKQTVSQMIADLKNR
ncbi:MAG: hypothetical protein WCS03_08065 [Bacteroidota bacterium]